MKEIALIVPNNIWVSPYLSIYIRLLEGQGIQYDIISWDREGRKETGIQFHLKEKSRNIILILWSYIKYSRFIKKTIKANKYRKLIVFTPQVGIFLSSFLERNYKNRYIFDYRDLSLEQNPLFFRCFKKVLSNSFANVISSSGFVKYLPSYFHYVISHNFDVKLVKKAIEDTSLPYVNKTIKVLTIGALRKDMNLEVIDALGNKFGFELSFVGKGIAAEELERYAKNNGIENVLFTGYYKKEEESTLYKSHTIVNIIYPLVPSHISAMSNRFYNSLVYKRPMIVTRHTVQGDYAEKYGVGLVIDDCQQLKEQVETYLSDLNFQKYEERCNQLLKSFLKETIKFEETVKSFLKQ